MSIRIMNDAWDLDIPSSEKLVLISLADQANDEGVTWPGKASMMRRTGLSKATIKRTLGSLRDRGLLSWAHRDRDNGSKRSNRYQIDVERVAAAATEARGGGVMVTPGGVHDDPGGGVMVNPLIEPSIETSEEPNLVDCFEKFYKAYPRKMKGVDASKAFGQIDGRKFSEQIMEGVRIWSKHWEAESTPLQYVPYPATFLRSEQWRDEPETKAATVTDTVPANDHDLEPWAASKGYPMARPGESFQDWRKRLQKHHRQQKETTT